MQSVNFERNRIASIVTDRGLLPVDQLIFATGAWTGTIFEHFFPGMLAPKINPVKGQMLLYEAKPDTLPFMVLADDHYLIPRLDGKILAGSSVEHSQFDKTPTEQTYHYLKAFAETLCPALKSCPISKHWAGLRPGTARGIPYISRHPEIENLSINAGHFRNGLVMAPASAQLMADIVLAEPTAVAPEPYRLKIE